MLPLNHLHRARVDPKAALGAVALPPQFFLKEFLLLFLFFVFTPKKIPFILIYFTF
jgi:hypothetical protein